MNHKLLLAAAALSMSSLACAMEAVQDEELSETSGQAGIDVTITPPPAGITFGLALHDTNGIPAPSTWVNSGALVIGTVAGGAAKTNFSITNPSGFLVRIDAGGKLDADKAMLQINLSSTAATTINTGDLTVGKSAATVGIVGTSQSGNILNNMTITVGAGTLFNMQLGNEEQLLSAVTQMITMSSTMTGGLTINNFALNDTSVGGGAIGATSIVLKDCTAANCGTVGADLAYNIGVNAVSDGLLVRVGSLGNATNGAYVKATGLTFGTVGTTPALGNLELFGLNMAGTTIKIAGH